MTSKVLVVGHGSSYRDYDYIRNFDGIILCVDTSTIDLIEHGIVPQYQLFSETHETITKYLTELLPDSLLDVRDKMVVVHRSQSIPAMYNRVGRLKLKSIIFDAERYGNTNAISNVGLYSIVFADEVLHPDEIHLIGLDFKGSEYSQRVYDDWMSSTLHYYGAKTSDCKIIDHSGGDFPKYKEKT